MFDLHILKSTHIAAFIVSFVIALVLGPMVIPLMKKLEFGQTVRDDGPATHLKKAGTPNMGGFIFIIPMVLVGLYYYRDYPQILPLVLVSVGFGAVGFIDDYIKNVKKRKDGLYANQKTVLQLLVATVFSIYVTYFTETGTGIFEPFFDYQAPRWLFAVYVVILMYATVNSVNLTDGLDGLLSGITLIIMVFFSVVGMSKDSWTYLRIFSSIAAGGCLGFLTFNLHPARIFMGDTGSLALGGAIGALAVFFEMPLILFIVGIIFVLESLSDIIQVVHFKRTGRRVFRMAPLHHHFELSGWKETKVVYAFWGVTLLGCLVGMFLLERIL